MEQHVFDYRGHHRKGVAFIMPPESIYNPNLGLIQKSIFELYREVQTFKYLLIDIIFVMKILFLVTLSELPPIGLC
jgi:hypothetical protein